MRKEDEKKSKVVVEEERLYFVYPLASVDFLGLLYILCILLSGAIKMYDLYLFFFKKKKKKIWCLQFHQTLLL